MAETLKPCPLCGSTDLKHYVTNARERNRGVIACKGCGLRLEAYSDEEYKVAQAYQGDFEAAHVFTWEQARQAVADKWNRRAERTCHMGAPIDGEYPCSECGHLNRDTYRADKGWFQPEYCAHCGARVVGE